MTDAFEARLLYFNLSLFAFCLKKWAILGHFFGFFVLVKHLQNKNCWLLRDLNLDRLSWRQPRWPFDLHQGQFIFDISFERLSQYWTGGVRPQCSTLSTRLSMFLKRKIFDPFAGFCVSSLFVLPHLKIAHSTHEASYPFKSKNGVT